MKMPRFDFVAAVFLVVGCGHAQAHAFLAKSEPAVGSTVTNAQAVIRLEFTEAIEIAFSGIDMTNASGSALSLKAVRFADAAHKVLMADLPMLTPGAYRVKWHVVSVDTHRSEGDFTFTVKP
jgi:methionine-rich copper-binding protein CopC